MNRTATLTRLQDPLIQFAHPAYQLAACFEARSPRERFFQTWRREDMQARIAESDVLVTSGFWEDSLLDEAPRLRFVQICAVGHDQFDLERLRERGVRLANGQGINANAVSEHAVALILALTRQLHVARDHQRRRHWRPLIADRGAREDELPGKTVLVYGAGSIGSRVGKLLRAFDAHLVGFKLDPENPDPGFHELHAPEAFAEHLPRADFVVLCCPLTEQTRNVINARTLALIRPTACLVNVARGACVDIDALCEALATGTIGGAGMDVTPEEPLPETSPLWGFDNVVITPHTAGETRRYEENVVDILVENLARLARGETVLRNQLV